MDLRAYCSGVDLEIGDPPASLVWLDVAQQAAGAVGVVAVCALLDAPALEQSTQQRSTSLPPVDP